MPSSGLDGPLFASAGKYARNCVLAAFEMIGGVDAMAAWADENRGDFYTKLFAKTITRENETELSGRVENVQVLDLTGVSESALRELAQLPLSGTAADA